MKKSSLFITLVTLTALITLAGIGVVIADTYGPTISILTPPAGTSQSKPTVKVLIQIWDGDGLPANPLNRSIDGGAFSSTGITLNSAYTANICGSDTNCKVYNYSWDISGYVDNSSHTIIFNGTDTVPNITGTGTGNKSVAMTVKAQKTGDGMLLARGRGTQTCMDCHNVKTHSSSTTDTGYRNWSVICSDCHTTHSTKNISVIKNSITFTVYNSATSDWSNTITNTVAFYNTTGDAPNSYVNSSSPSGATGNLGICQVCHTQTTYWKRTGATGHYATASTQKCTACHDHTVGLKASCISCHGYPPVSDASLVNANAKFGATGRATQFTGTGAGAHNLHYNTKGYACDVCHKGGGSGGEHDKQTTPARVQMGYNLFSGAYLSGFYQAPDFSDPDYDLINGNAGTTVSVVAGSRNCSSIYCHSDGSNYAGAFTYAKPGWGGSALSCSSCHNDPATTDKHPKHTGTYTYKCVECHADTVNASKTVIGNHVNNAKNIRFGGAIADSGTYTRPNCSSTYCHSAGTGVSNATGQIYTVPSWNGAVPSCSGCHGAPPAYTNKQPKANSHGQADHAAKTCEDCHYTTATGSTTIKNYSLHVNKAYNVVNSASVTFQYYYSPMPQAGGCSNISCHGGAGANAVWGTTSVCSNCHVVAGNDLNNWNINDGTASKVNTTEWTFAGHGKDSGNYNSGNPAAAFPTAASGGDPCRYCHDTGVAHKIGSNPFRLANYNATTYTGASGTNGGFNSTCLICHGPSAIGYDPDGGDPMQSKIGTIKVADAHYDTAAKHNTTRNGGKFCWDCHDPHGDQSAGYIGNWVMLQWSISNRTDLINGTPTNTVSSILNSVDTWGSYARSDYKGVCQVCHTATARFLASGSTWTADQSHNAGTSCAGCHAHSGSSAKADDAFPGAESSGGTECSGCHADLKTEMQSTIGYHHYMNNLDATYAAIAQPANLGTSTDAKRNCLMCHTDHDIFRPDINTANGGRAKNLRASISCTPAAGTPATYSNSDFINNAAYQGGICLSCHVNSQPDMGYTQPDGSVAKPAIPIANFAQSGGISNQISLYNASAHNYNAVSTYSGTLTTAFGANCSKCHNDTMNPKSSYNSQNSTNKFGLHDSSLRNIEGQLGNGIIANALYGGLEENFCFRCHSNVAPLSSNSPTYGAPTSQKYDWYNGVLMSVNSTAIYDAFYNATGPQPYGHGASNSALTGIHNAVETQAGINARKHVECEDCHNPHSAGKLKHAKGTNIINAGSVLNGVTGAIANFASGNWNTNSTFALGKATKEYEICFKCHSNANTNYASWDGRTGAVNATDWTDVALEFSPNNRSGHPVVINANGRPNSLAPKALTASWMVAPWTNVGSQKMYCSDCHDTNSTYSRGPHGSSVKWMLAGANKAWPYPKVSNNASMALTGFWMYNNRASLLNTPDGLFCRNCHTLGSSAHTASTGHQTTPCLSCHIRVPHGGKVSRLIRTLNAPARYQPNGAGGTTAIYITTFTKAASYSSTGNCMVTGCSSHTTAASESW